MELTRRRVIYLLVMLLLLLGLWHDGRTLPTSVLYLIAPLWPCPIFSAHCSCGHGGK